MTITNNRWKKFFIFF